MHYFKRSTLVFFHLSFCLSVFSQSGVIGHSDSYTTPFHDNTYDLQGSLYLFDKMWVHAKVELPDNRILQNDSLFFNYDKMHQSLLVTKDFKNMTTVPKENFKSVTFIWKDSIDILEHVSLINSSDLFFELLRDDKKYSLYKNIVTVFNQPDLHSNGLVTEGNSSATIVDHPTYFVVFENKEYKKLNKTDKKSIEKAFSTSPDYEKVKTWLDERKEKQGEALLWDLIIYLNN